MKLAFLVGAYVYMLLLSAIAFVPEFYRVWGVYNSIITYLILFLTQLLVINSIGFFLVGFYSKVFKKRVRGADVT